MRPICAPNAALRDAELPAGVLAAWLRGAAARALGIQPADVPLDRSLVGLGLDSLAAAELAAAIEADLAVPVSIADLLEGPSVTELAERIAVLQAADSPGSEAASSGEPGQEPKPEPSGALAQGGDAAPDRQPLRHALTQGQQALLALDRRSAGGAAYIISAAALIEGDLSVARLRAALAALMARHPALRATFHESAGETEQVVRDQAAFEWVEEAAEGWSDAQLRAWMAEQAHRPFDLEAGPVLRVALLGCGARRHRLVFAVHHLVADFGSLGILLADLRAHYGGAALPPPAPGASYAQVARREAAWVAGPEGQVQAAFWRGQFAGGVRALDLPADRPRPPLPSFRGGARGLRFDAEVSRSLAAVGREVGATPFMTLLAVYVALLHRLSGTEDFWVGTPAAGRRDADLDGVVGYFVNPVAVHARIGARPRFEELLRRQRAAALAAFAHQRLPFALAAAEVAGGHDPSRSPVFQTMFVLYRERAGDRGLAALAMGEGDTPLDLGGGVVVLRPAPLERRAAQLDLTLQMAEIDGCYAASLVYSDDLFDAATAARMLGQLRSLAEAVAAPGGRTVRVAELPLLSAAESHQLMVEWQGQAGAEPAGDGLCLHQLFERRAALTPAAVALVCEGAELTYGQLSRSANRLARHLRRFGVGPEVRVALCLERGIDLVVALLAVLKAGGAYVPLDPGYPRERLRFVAADALADVEHPVLITRRQLAGLFAPAAPAPDAAAPGAAAPGAAALDAAAFDAAARRPFRLLLVDGDRQAIAAESAQDLAAGAAPAALAYVIYTSGSTGRPKGVMVSHANVTRLLRQTERWYGFGARDVWPLCHSAAFDVSVWEIWGALLYGGRLVIVPYWASRAPNALHRLLVEQRVTVLNQTPSAFRQLIEADAAADAAARRDLALRWVIFAGEAIDLASLRPWVERHGEAAPRLANMYGITETTVHSTWRALTAADLDDPGRSPIGVGIADLSLYLLDAAAQPVPLGVPGEIHVGGAGVARGYLARPDLTAARFVPDAWAGAPGGGRLYRSGDLARWRPGGDLEYLGRMDHQVKIRGFRVELGEIEAALAVQPGVRAAAVTLWSPRSAGPAASGVSGGAVAAGEDARLVAYVVMGEERATQADGGSAARTATAVLPPTPAGQLRQALASRLPEHMVPASFVFLEAFPVTPSGKLDRRALPPPASDGRMDAAGWVAPRTAAEELVADLFAAVLAVGRVGAQDSFFALGGHSLLATRLVTRVRAVFGVDLVLRQVFEHPTVAELARLLTGMARLDHPRAPPLLPAARSESAPGAPAVAGPIPLSYAQERLWFLDRLVPRGAVYNLPGALRLRGPLDVPALAASLRAIVRRHQVLRTVYPAAAGNAPRQQVLADFTLPIPLVDLAGLGLGGADDGSDAHGMGDAIGAAGASGGTGDGVPAAHRVRQAAAWQVAVSLAREPFDLACGPLVRVHLLRLGAAHHLLILTLHHIVADGWSVGIFLRELAALYAACVAPARPALPALAPLPIAYADFARWQRAWMEGERLAAELAHWRRVLAGAPPRTELPADRPRPPAPSYRGGRTHVLLPPAALRDLRGVARQQGATLFMALLAAFDALIARHGGREDLVVGTPVANRERIETEGLIGCFVNSLPLRVSLAGRPHAGELVARVRQASLDAFAHQDLPFEKLVESLSPERDLTAPPVFQLMLVVQNAGDPHDPHGGDGGLRLELCAIDTATAKFDLLVEAVEAADGLRLGFEFSRDLFDAVTVKRFAAHFVTLAAALGGEPPLPIGELPLLTAGERQQLREWNDTAAAPPRHLCLHQLIEQQARRTPAAVAVVDGEGGSLTYAALDAAANRLARRLRHLGAGAETVVAVCAERSVALVVGLLAILKAGAAYLPLDPDYPAERLRFMRQDAGAPLLLTERRVAARLGEPLPPPAAASASASAGTVWLDDLDSDSEPWAPGKDQAGRPDGGLGATAAADNLAYVIYTSGSTGRPKGTMNSHRGIVNRLLWMQQRYRLAADDRVLQKTPLSFDVSVWELFWPLLAGARLVMARPGGHRDPAYLLAAIADQAITTVHFVPAMLAAFLAAASDAVATPAGRRPDLSSLRRVLASGEALPYELQQEHAARIAAPLHNLYGPTEAAVDVTSWQTDPAGARRLVPIGRPVANTSIHLLDRDGRQVPVGAAGELHIGGVQVGRGYLGRPDLTAERFVPAAVPAVAGDPHGARLYRTGDLARHLADGAIDYLGRLDGQVKIRGLRVELGEIEAALAAHPAVRAAAVALRPLAAAAGAPVALVGYLVAAASPAAADRSAAAPAPAAAQAVAAPAEAAALRQFLAARLPRHMLPAALVWLPQLPLSPSGKVDRGALPPPHLAGGRDAAAAAARLPESPSEQLVAACFGELLGVEPIGLDDDFFARGGHSLLATRLVSRLRQLLGVEVPLREVFEGPTVAALAHRIDRLLAGGDAAAAAPPIRPAPRDLPLPLSFAQQRLWFLDQLQPGSPLYNLPLALGLDGELAIAGLRAALAALVARQEALRTVFAVPAGGGDPFQRILPAAPQPLPLVDLTGLPAARREPLARELAAATALLPFDLARGPLARARLVRLAEQRHVLLLALHHIVGDGWSLALIVDEIAAHYTAAVAAVAAVAGVADVARPLPALPVQYGDFAVWQRRWLQGDVLQHQLDYWRRHLAGAPAQLDLPLDRPRPPVQSGRGGTRRAAFDARLTEALRCRSRAGGGTLFMTLLAAFQLLLARHAGQDDVVVGTPIANRTRGEIEGVVGMFVNTLALRTRIAPEAGFGHLLASVREVTLGAFARQDLPFERLVEELRPERARSHSPLFQVMFALQAPTAAPPPAAGVALSLFAEPGTGSKFDLTLSLREVEAGLTGCLEHRRDLFDPATAERLLAAFGSLLTAVAHDAGKPLFDLPLLADAQRHQLVAEWGAGAVTPPPAAASLHHRFTDQARRTPQAVAVVHGGEHLTFGELDRSADRLARELRRLGVGAGAIAGICAQRSPAMIVALLAVLKAGGAYLPLDPGYPPERLAFMAADAGIAVLLHDAAAAPGGRLGGLAPGAARFDLAGLPELRQLQDLRGLPQPDAPAPADDDGGGAASAAYVIYTSGSTGTPKGVVVSHGAICNHMAWTLRILAPDARDAVLQRTTASFDASVWEIFLPLWSGARLVLLDAAAQGDADRMLQAIAVHGVTILQTVPSLLALLCDRPRLQEHCRSLRRVICGGETLTTDIASRFERQLGAPHGPRLLNFYGPTEAAVDASWWPCQPGDASERGMPIGRPIDNLDVAVLDATGRMAPIGAIGELHLGGAGLARGYLARPELTAARFVPDPRQRRAGGRLYRTGDLARFRAGGQLEYCGRTDHQVKVRGFRIETGEIEAALLALPGVEQAAVAVVAAATGDRRLVAYVAAPPDAAPPDPAALRAELRRRLPEFMVPAAWVTLPRLPRTAQGKLDRQALARIAPRPGAVLSGSPASGEPLEPWAPGGALPRSPGEELIAGVWQEVLSLGDARPGPGDNFFELGGHSLLATQVVSRLAAMLHVDLPVATVFESPTLAAFAAAVETARGARPRPAIPRAPRRAPLPLSYAQERLWFLDRLQPGQATYNMPVAFAARGHLAPAILDAALGEVLRRHEALRTRFVELGDRPMQHFDPPRPPRLPLVDLAALPGGRRAAEGLRIARAEAGRPFDLAAGPLLRGLLVRRGGPAEPAAAEHVVLLNVHHIVSDGWSMGVLVAEIGALYRAAIAGAPSPLPELPVQYADFAVWQRGWLDEAELGRQLAWWRQRLTGAPAAVELPTDRPRPMAQSGRGGLARLHLGAAATAALAAAGRRRGVTLFMALFAGCAALLARLGRQEDLVVGTPIANRHHLETERMIGFFVNSLALRCNLGGDPTTAELFGRVRETALAAYAHQDLPFERLVAELRPERLLSQNPIFQVMCALQNAPLGALDLPGLDLAPLALSAPTAKFDLALSWSEQPDAGGALACELRYAADLFDAPTAARLLGHLRELLAGLAAQPGRRVAELPLLGAAERHQVLCEWNASTWQTGGGDPTLLQLVHAPFERQAAREPAAEAVVDGDRTVSYGELAALARRAAARLRAAGVGPDRPVALCAWPSIELVAALFGILRAGGAYLPLDPAHPRERLAQVLADSGAAVVVAEPATIDRLPPAVRPMLLAQLVADPDPADGSAPAPAPGSPPAPALPAALEDVQPDHAAYVLYTSGSTGMPKGVVVSHRAVCNRLRFQVEADLAPGARVLQRTRLGFDVSVIELFAPLWAGAVLVVAPPAQAQDAASLARLVVAQRITNLTAPPGLFPALLAEPAFCRSGSLRRLVTGGDRVPADLARRLADAFDAAPVPPQLWSRYGPTEATVSVSEWDCRLPASGPTVPLGRPLAGARLYVVDRALQPVPPGVPGELCIAGVCLARGYHGRPDLTAAAFVPDPHGAGPRAGGRLYRTGDLVRRRSDGVVEFLGRLDWQVKVRGFRIETGEIESVLAGHPAVRQVVVVAVAEGGAAADADGAQQQLVAYVVPRAQDAGAGGERTLPSAVAAVTAVTADEHVAAWNALYEEVHPHQETGDPALDFAGWNSSYDGAPIPVAEMREWADAAARLVLSLAPRRPRVVEVGCGAGLLLLRVAPHCASYQGVDFSRSTLAVLAGRLARPGHELPQVTLTHAPADRWQPHAEAGGGARHADLVILNSVVQYFPSVDYLLQVLRHAAAVVVPGGRIFLGDVRSLDLAEALYTSIELAAAPDDLAVEELRRRVLARRDDDEELLLAPRFWHALRRHLPAVSHVDLRVKRGRAINELSGYRYDVVLTLGGQVAAAGLPPELLVFDATAAAFNLEVVGERLAAAAGAPAADAATAVVEIQGLLDRRLAAEAAAIALLAQPESEPWTVGELRRALAARLAREPGVSGEDVWQLGASLGYQVELLAGGADSAGGFRFTARLRRPGQAAAAAAPPAIAASAAIAASGTSAASGVSGATAAVEQEPGALAALASNPLRGRLNRELAAELRRRVAAQLPDYMVPAAFVMLERLPMTAHGKLDRAALPAPKATRQAVSQRYSEPRTPLEKSLAELWGELLGRERIGREDSFFELGGHSLLAVRLMARLRQRFGRELPVAALFRADTVERLAALLSSGRGAAVTRALVELTPPPAAGPAGPGSAGRVPPRPLFCVHPAGGNVLCYTALARALGSRQPLYGLQLPDAETLGPDPTIEALAARYVTELTAVAPAGPYALGGWSLGGVIAYEMARQLRAAGAQVDLLALIDPSPVRRNGAAPAQAEDSRLLADFGYDLVALAGNGSAVPAATLQRLDRELTLPRLVAAAHAAGLLPPELEVPEVERLFALYRTTRRALDRYRPRPTAGPLTLLLAGHPLPAPPLPAGLARRNGSTSPPVPFWAAVGGAGTEIESLPGDHYSIVRPPAVAILARKLRRRLAAISLT